MNFARLYRLISCSNSQILRRIRSAGSQKSSHQHASTLHTHNHEPPANTKRSTGSLPASHQCWPRGECAENLSALAKRLEGFLHSLTYNMLTLHHTHHTCPLHDQKGASPAWLASTPATVLPANVTLTLCLFARTTNSHPHALQAPKTRNSMAEQQQQQQQPHSSPFEQLSEELLQRVLECVPQKERLTQLACVSSAWKQAAVLGTTHIKCDSLKGRPAAAALEPWLDEHGARVRSLVLCASGMLYGRTVRLRLPWPLLNQLEAVSLSYIELPPVPTIKPEQTSAGGGGDKGGRSATATAILLPQLKQLTMHMCIVHSGSCLLQLANSPQLTKLQLSIDQRFRSLGRGYWHDVSPAQRRAAAADTAMLLQQLPALVALNISGLPVVASTLQHITSMEHLQSLSLSIAPTSANVLPAALPRGLTYLHLSDFSRDGSSRMTLESQQLQRLTSLRELQLFSCKLHPAALGGLKQLHKLYLHCGLLPNVTQGAVALLGAMQQLTCLQRLSLGSQLALHAAHAPAQLFASLTASSQLVQLSLSAGDVQPLPEGVLQHALPAGKRLLHLQELAIVCEWDGVNEQPGWCVDSCDLASNVSCCPNLTQLHIEGIVRGGADVSPLLQLSSSCRQLQIGGDGFTDAAAPVIARLPHVTDLSWDYSPGLTDVGVEALTAMGALDSLSMSECRGISKAVFYPDEDEEEVEQMGLMLTYKTSEEAVRSQGGCGEGGCCLRWLLCRRRADVESPSAVHCFRSFA